MHFQGLPLPQLLAIGGAAALAIGALYLLKLRRRAFPVPFAKLWERVLRDKDSTTLFARLKQLVSFLLQLLLLALLVLALGDPRIDAGIREGRSLVVLVDASASMQAIDVAPANEPNRRRLDEAKDEVLRIVRGKGRADRMLIAQMDARLLPLSTLTTELSELEAAVDRVAATDTRADLPRALRFAKDVLRGLPSPEIIVVSDGALGEPSGDIELGDVTLSHLPIGKRGRNVAVTGLTVRRYPLDRDRYEVMLELYNAGDEAEEVELTLLGDREVVDVTRLHLGPREVVPRFYPSLSGAKATLEAVVQLADGSRDDLAVDDRAHALLPEPKRAKILCVTRGNTFLEAALLLAAYLDVTYVTPEDFERADGSFDVTIFDGATLPVTARHGHLLYLDPTGPSAPVGVRDKPIVNVGFDKVDKKSPLLRFTAVEDAFIGKARKLVPGAGDKVIGASDLGPLLVTGTRGGQRFVALAFDPRDSDIVLRASWPVFVLNTLNELAEGDAAYLSSFRTGEAWHVPVSGDAESVTIESPRGQKQEVPVQDGRAVIFGTEAGFYTLTSKGGASRFAANLADPVESTVKPVPKLAIQGTEAAEVTGFHEGRRYEYWAYLLLAAALLTTLEWVTYHRRITV